jgi:tetratricopeptide (TPR) repeat protein
MVIMQFYPSGHRIARRYEVAGRPLFGGMGIVYLCFDHQEQRPVALKTFRPEYLPDRAARERFLQEGETWVRLGKHPHIVRCHAVFQDPPRPEVYLALELIANEDGRRDASLRSWLTPGRPLPVERALLIGLQIARGMAHATTVIPGFVHRDLKPENVLVGADRLSNAPINRVRVTDFGLVKGLRAEQLTATGATDLSPAASRLTAVGALVGTPAYMAPEQWEGADVTAQIDIYALGCILGEMLTGYQLTQGGTPEELRQAHRGGQALAAVLVAPVALADLLGHCLAVEPGQRYVGWGVVEAALAAEYRSATGRPAPEPEAASVLSRAEQVAAGWSYGVIGSSYLQMGDAQAALGYFQQENQTGQVEKEPRLEAAGLTDLGNAYLRLGDVRRAKEHYERALAMDREIGDRAGEGTDLGNLGEAYRLLGNIQEAIGYYEQGLAIRREIGDRVGEGNTMGDLGIAYRQLGDLTRAIWYYEQALAIRREIGDRVGEGRDLGNLGIAYRQLGDVQQAVDCYERAVIISREIGDGLGEGNALGNLGVACQQLGETRRAIWCYERALAIRRAIGDHMGEGRDLSNLGIVHGNLGDVRRAIGYYEQAFTVWQELDDLVGMAEVSLNMVLLYKQQGNQTRALYLAREAARLWGDMGQVEYAQRAQQLVTQLEG